MQLQSPFLAALALCLSPSTLLGQEQLSVVHKQPFWAPDGAVPLPVVPAPFRPAVPAHLLEEPAPAGSSEPAPVLSLDPNQGRDRLYFDEQDGVIWTMGRNYKAFADASGFGFVPFLGSEAPRNFPVTMRLESVTLAGDPLTFDAQAKTTREGNRVRLDQGSVVTLYDMGVDSVEQSFVVQAAGSQGALALTLAVETELAWERLEDGVAFSHELGGVSYRHAIVIDGAGKRLALPIQADHGSVRIEVPAEFLAQAVDPIIVDPIFLTFGINSSAAFDQKAPDVAYDITPGSSTARIAFVHQRAYSATDHDLWIETHDATSGNFLHGNYVDLTTFDTTQPSIATDVPSHQFLVVGLKAVGSGLREVRGRTFDAFTLNQSPSFLIGDAISGSWSNVQTDVGGKIAGSSLFKVVWQRYLNSTGQHGIRSASVTPVVPHSTTVAPTVSSVELVAQSPTDDYSNVHISKTSGEVFSQEWRVVYLKRNVSSNAISVETALYADNNTLTLAPTYLYSSLPGNQIDHVDVSGPNHLLPGPLGAALVYCVVVSTTTSLGSPIHVFGVQGSTGFSPFILGNREHQSINARYYVGSVANLNRRFAIPYIEWNPATNRYRGFLSTIDFLSTDMEFGVRERRIPLGDAGATFGGSPPSAVSAYEMGLLTQDVALVIESSAGAHWNVQGTMFSTDPGWTPGYQYCIGTPNSSGDYGFVTIVGSQYNSGAKLLLASALPLNQFGYFVVGQGGTGMLTPPGSAGTLCISGGPIGRYNQAGEILFTGATGTLTLYVNGSSLRGPSGNVLPMNGSTWNFQAWHRESGGSSNFTNAVSLTFY